ncbi:MAG: YafY family transcriptional regulator [Candidatus Thiodiazotropha lotti]|uniref:HTH deoR-type domain-containing protein n=1 Tax=Candidatus Thiodiazotropha endoloripes TaxID=1818881 RepID=A0A1E2UM90_9GAMM|nr:YafY family protein [Candidatus Thiodiazotropha endoloripes]MCG7897055.1 YafY family transcriptional regulator [Candidatus Thiodiazotropha weberae]MCG7991715.1 YafY family transcriptional regulator [Candidatus Thiodiazotropha lotti]MCG7904501.1 YafY family transcriptional regulator [Candidatus Thiodiazotropha weberae]MCG7913156.1 YafY family transcriptional regulator [Candidatus Thiodiazotropha weberae]MCG7999739.1 YafY family transcriptional regulator [Candidatus Thiodiazotropha lotti]
MRRADRLFRITQELSAERYITAESLAARLEVSVRTIYRDIDALSASGIPIEAVAGSGYRLSKGFRVPPLMFNEEELTALMLGMRMVQGWCDTALAEAASSALGKVAAVVPERIRPVLSHEALLVPDFHIPAEVRQQVARLRKAIAQQRKIEIAYRRRDGVHSDRVIWPLGLFYWGSVWTLAAWCELREGFRQFRVDRIESLQMANGRYPQLSGRTLKDYLISVDEEAD